MAEDTTSTTTPSGTQVRSQGTPIYDAMGNFTGYHDDSPATPPPSPDIAKPADTTPPEPTGGPIVVAKQIKMDNWTIYFEQDNLWVKTAAGKKLQIVLFDPTGTTEIVKPNKLSDGSDGSKGTSIGGNNVPYGSEVKVENPTSGNLPAPAGAGSAPNVPSTTSVLPSIPSIGLGTTLPFILTNFLPSYNNVLARAAVDAFLGRAIDDTEWRNLIAAVNSESGKDPLERGYVAGAILNRARDAGANVATVLNQPAQYPSVTGFNPDSPTGTHNFLIGPTTQDEQNIYQVLTQILPDIPRNNYYTNSINPASVPAGACVITERSGIQGVLVGQSLVYPGAKWP